MIILTAIVFLIPAFICFPHPLLKYKLNKKTSSFCLKGKGRHYSFE